MRKGNIKLKDNLEYTAKGCKIELKDGTILYANDVKYEEGYLPSAGDYLPEDVYHCYVWNGKGWSYQIISRFNIRKMSIVRGGK